MTGGWNSTKANGRVEEVKATETMAPPAGTSSEHSVGTSGGRPFVILVIVGGLVFSGLDLFYGISPDLPKISSSSDPLLALMLLFIVLCFVGASGTFILRSWGLIISGLVSIGFILGANVINAWIPTLSNPSNFNTFVVADSIVPVLVLVAIFSILSFMNRRRGLRQKRYLNSGRSFSGILTAVVALLVVSGAVVGFSVSAAGVRAGNSVSVSIPIGAFDPSSAAIHFSPSTITVIMGVNNTVSWTNSDYTIHTVTSDSGLFNSGLLNNGNAWTYTFTAPGTYGYHCAVHPYMMGTVIVKGR